MRLVSSCLLPLRDYRARAEGAGTCSVGLRKEPQKGDDRRRAGLRRLGDRPSPPAEGRRVSRGPRVLAGAPRPLPSRAPTPPSQLSSLPCLADALARPHEQASPSYLPARGLGLLPAAHRGPGQRRAHLPPQRPARALHPAAGGM